MYQDFGDQIEFGTYYMGGDFSLTDTNNFHSKQTTSQAKAIANREISVSLSGGGGFSAFSAAGSGAYNNLS